MSFDLTVEDIDVICDIEENPLEVILTFGIEEIRLKSQDVINVSYERRENIDNFFITLNIREQTLYFMCPCIFYFVLENIVRYNKK